MGSWSKNDTGLALLEVMFTSGILGLALVMLLGSLISVVEVGRIAESREIAATHLGTVMENLHRATYEQLLAYEPPALEGLGPTEKVVVACLDRAGKPIPLPVDPETLAEPLPYPLEIRVEITWVAGRARSLSASSSMLYLGKHE